MIKKLFCIFKREELLGSLGKVLPTFKIQDQDQFYDRFFTCIISIKSNSSVIDTLYVRRE